MVASVHLELCPMFISCLGNLSMRHAKLSLTPVEGDVWHSIATYTHAKSMFLILKTVMQSGNHTRVFQNYWHSMKTKGKNDDAYTFLLPFLIAVIVLNVLQPLCVLAGQCVCGFSPWWLWLLHDNNNNNNMRFFFFMGVNKLVCSYKWLLLMKIQI